jgi:hypothetical protein
MRTAAHTRAQHPATAPADMAQPITLNAELLGRLKEVSWLSSIAGASCTT